MMDRFISAGWMAGGCSIGNSSFTQISQNLIDPLHFSQSTAILKFCTEHHCDPTILCAHCYCNQWNWNNCFVMLWGGGGGGGFHTACSSPLLPCFSLTSHQRHGVLNHLQLYSLFNCLFRLKTKNIKAPHCRPFVDETTHSTQRPSNTESVAMSWHHRLSLKV